MTDKILIDAQKLDDAMANYPEFFDLDLADIETATGACFRITGLSFI